MWSSESHTHLHQYVDVLRESLVLQHPAHGMLGAQHQNHRTVDRPREGQRFQHHRHLWTGHLSGTCAHRWDQRADRQRSRTCVLEALPTEITWVSLAPPSLAAQPVPASKRSSWACTGCSASTGHMEHCSSLLDTDTQIKASLFVLCQDAHQ